MKDVIVSISTPLGIGAISIVRMSGKDAIMIANKVFLGTNLNKVLSHTIHYGKIVDKKEVIDEVLVSVFKAPKTFTKEDIVEINTHGGINVTNKVLILLLKNGARLALPGEFTKRAYLNGRIDLIEAEAVMDLINAKSDEALTLALSGVEKKQTLLVKSLRDKILELMANIEVNIDYPEIEDIEEVTNKLLASKTKAIKEEITEILNKSKSSSIIKEGINVIIVGRPNVGKSSLLNLLLQEEKAIVTDVAGTTRDMVEGKINLDGIILNIIDTAGIRNTSNIVEKIGVEKTKERLKTSDLILMILDNTDKLNFDDKKLLKQIKDKRHILVVNKVDQEKKIDYKNDNIIYISAKENIGIDELKNKIKELFNLEKIKAKDFNALSNKRQILLLESTLNIVKQIEKGIKDNIPIDILEIDIKKAYQTLGEIIGENTNNELIDQIFASFCLGK